MHVSYKYMYMYIIIMHVQYKVFIHLIKDSLSISIHAIQYMCKALYMYMYYTIMVPIYVIFFDCSWW